MTQQEEEGVVTVQDDLDIVLGDPHFKRSFAFREKVSHSQGNYAQVTQSFAPDNVDPEGHILG